MADKINGRNASAERCSKATRNLTALVSLLVGVMSLSSCTQTRTFLQDVEKPLATASLTSLDLCFVKSKDGDVKLINVKRKAGILRKNKLETAVRALLDGPTAEESADGYGSEIPRGTILLGMNESDGNIELNLSHRFASNGGVDSIETRLAQIARTVKTVVGNQPVFLNVEGRRLTMTPGEGVEVQQPINQ